MKKQWEEATNNDVRLVREAVEHSQRCSNMKNPMLALVEATNAKRTIEVLVKRYGIQRTEELTGQDIGNIYDTLTRQHDRVMNDISERYPEMVPKGELKSYKKYVRERDDSRDDEVPHLDLNEMMSK